MKSILITKRFVLQLICISCVFALLQCSKSEFSDEENHPVVPFFDYSSVAFIARITYNSADWSLCAIDKSGNGMRKIVDKTVACQKPIRSHSGTKLLFTVVKFDHWNDENNTFHSSYEYELYIVNIDGTGLTLIDRIDPTADGRFGGVAWSPDDSQIVYVRWYYHYSVDPYWDETNLILFNISDNTRTILQTEGNVCSPKFSPDGKHIAYCTLVENGHHIYKMNVSENTNQVIISNASSPSWSPQGNKITYLSSGKEGSSQIFVANADGSNQKQLTSTISPRRWPGWPPDGNSDPQWTPDGKKIVYVSYENEKSEIFIMNADGSKKTQLTKAELMDEHPEVTPDGKHILFVSRISGNMTDGGISVMSLNGKNQRVLHRTGYNPVACR